MYTQVSRIAILIGCPGGIWNNTKYLNGVRRDLRNMREYLLSDRGGAWRENEIITIPFGFKADVLATIRKNVADYVFIYYSGHGITDLENNKRYLCFQDKDVLAVSLFNDSSRQLIIADACGSYAYARISGIDQEEWIPFDGLNEAREQFDRYIRSSDPGKVIIYATREGNSTNDTSLGGNFTNSLLHSASKTRPIPNYTPLMIKDIIQAIPKQELDYNIPRINQSGNLSIPFALALPNIVKQRTNLYSPASTKKSVQNHSEINWGNVALLALGVAGVLALFDDRN